MQAKWVAVVKPGRCDKVSKSLYERLGGAEGIAQAVEAAIEEHMNNPVIGPRFRPYRERPTELEAAKAHLRNFFGMGSGGPETYSGRSMADAHRGMNISETEYMAAIDDILAVLDKHGADDQTRNDVLAIVYSLKGEIMHK